jgi:signal transduction histidine kinase
MLFRSKSAQAIDDEVTQRVLATCEQLMSEMGADIHDDLIQKLSTFGLHLDQLTRANGDITEIESHISKMTVEYGQIVSAVRQISRRLMPLKYEGETLLISIRRLCQNLDRPGGSTIHFQSTGNESILDPKTETHLYRMIQELLHNALRHSAAWHIWVRISWSEKEIVLEVEDDGTAFSEIPVLIDALNRKHNTLRMRSEVIGAKINYRQGSKGLLAIITMAIK